MAKNNSTTLESFEVHLFKAADKLRKNIDAAEYKHIVLGLIFLKYISDSFEELHVKLSEGKNDYEGADPEDQDEYKALNVFWVPKKARWSYLQPKAKLPSIGLDLDEAMEAIEKENPTLKGILPKVYARPNLDKSSLGGLIDLISNVTLSDEAARSKDILGQVYEYFLGQFAAAEGKKGGQFYTPKSVVKLLVEIIEPYKGRVFDPCCGSGGMFVMSEKFVKEHQGRLDDISVYGQESNQTTYRLCRMNLAIRGIDGSQVKWNNEGSFLKDAHPDLKADFILANPPFNDSDWNGDLLKSDGRWKYGVPPESNANFAWIQHFIYHLAPKGLAAFVMHPGASSNKGREAKIRQAIVENNLVDCIVYTPTQLFYNTSLPVHLWIVCRDRSGNTVKRDRSNEILMIDATEFGYMTDSTHRSFTEDDISKISSVYHEWSNRSGNYKDIEGFCRSVSLKDIKEKNYVLAPNRFVAHIKKINSLSMAEVAGGLLNNIGTNTKRIDESVTDNGLLKKDFSKALVSKLSSKKFKSSSWQTFEVREVIKEITSGEWGYDSPRSNYVECKVIRGTDFPNIPLYNLDKIPSRYIKEDKLKAKSLKAFDLVIEMSGGSKNQPTGRSVFITQEFLDRYDLPVLYSNFCKRVRVNEDIVDPIFFNLYWNMIYKEGLTSRYENQPSGIKNFQLEEFITSEVIDIPKKEIQQELVEMLRPLVDLRETLSSTSNLLKNVEDKIFDKLYYNHGE